MASIEQLFDTYYANLALFSEMISKISNDITDAHQKVIDVTNALVDQLDPREAITQIGTGVVLSSVLGVKDINGNLEAILNGSDNIEEAQSTKHGNHGKIVFAGGINGSSKWDDATTIIYEDGHIVINSGEISDFVSIGNATFKNVVEAVTQFDVISSPHVNPDTGEIEYIPLFQVNRNDAGEIIYVSSVYDFVGNREISALGFNAGGGSSGGGLISQVFGTTAFGTIASESNSATFNAYAIDSLYKRIVSLEGKATAVSFVPALTSGKQIGTLSIDGVSTVLYGVDAYSKTDADSTFLKLSGGEIKGYLSVHHNTQSIALGVANSATDYTAIRFTGKNGNSAYLVYSGTGDTWEVTNVNWNRTSALLHANNYSQYALPLSGGALLSSTIGCPLYLANTKEDWNVIGFKGKSHSDYAYLGLGGNGNFFVTTTGWGAAYTLLHSGNYNSYAPKLDGTGASGTWGIDINGTSRYLKTSAFTAVNANELTYTNCALRFISALAGSSTNLPATTSYQNAILTLSLHDNGSTAQLYFTKGVENFYYRSQHTGDWKTVAFTDSTVDKAKSVVDANGNALTLIHSGNIGSQNAGGLVGQYVLDINNASANKVFSSGFQPANRPSENYATGWTLYNDELKYTYQLAYNTNGILYSRYKNTSAWSDWKTVAFIDSTVAAANELYSPNGTGYVRVYDDKGSLSFGVGHYRTYVDGSTIAFRYGTAYSTAMFINESGNVGIGTNAPEHKLHVNGNVAAIATDTTPRSFRAINTNGTISLLSSTSRGVYDSTNSRWLIGTNGTNSFLLCGNVGIGTDGPTYKLDVNGSMNVFASGATARHIHVTNSVGNMSLHVAASGKRGLYDSTIDHWMIYTDGTSVYFPSKPLSITHAVTMSSTLSVSGLLTANSGVKVASGQALTVLDASGVEHKLTYDSTAGAFKFDGSVYATEEVSAMGLSSSVSSEYLGYNLLLLEVNGADMAVKHGTTITAQTADTLNFKGVYPTDIDRACIIYIIKATSSNLSVPPLTSSGIRMVSSSGAAATTTVTVSGVAGIMLIWDTTSACWRGSII